MENKETKKSKLQIKLESEGWELLTNTNIEREDSFEIKRLKKDYVRKGFSDVKLADAYDVNGNFIPGYRSVYVKR